MIMAMLTGIYRAIGADSTTSDLALYLFQFTISPSYSYFGELEVKDGVRIASPLTEFASFVQLIWTILSYIVLMNTLVAMMNTTYSQVTSSRTAYYSLLATHY